MCLFTEIKARFIYGYLTSGVHGEKTRIPKWCVMTRLLSEGPALELVIALRIMSFICSVSLWPAGFLQRAWKCSLQWTLSAGCALFALQQLFLGSTWGPIKPCAPHSEFTRGDPFCCQGCQQEALLALSWGMGNTLSRLGAVSVTPGTELSLGAGDRALSLRKWLLADLSKTFCLQLLSSYTSKVSLYSFFLQAFYPYPPLFFFFTTFLLFLVKNLIFWLFSCLQ